MIARWMDVCTAVALIGCTARVADAATATLTGRVTDATGTMLSGATVTATNTTTNVANVDVTDRDGIYVLTDLAVGTYRIKVELVGFRTIVTPDVQLHDQDTIALNFQLEPGLAIANRDG